MFTQSDGVHRILLFLFFAGFLGVFLCSPEAAHAQMKTSYRPVARLLDAPLSMPIRHIAHSEDREEARPSYTPLGRRARRMMVVGGVNGCAAAAGIMRLTWVLAEALAYAKTDLAYREDDHPASKFVTYGFFVAPALACPAGTALMVHKVGKAFGREGRLRNAMLGAYVGFGAGVLLPSLISRRLIPEKHADRLIFSWPAMVILFAPPTSALFAMLEYKRSDKARFLEKVKSPSLAVTPAPGGGMAGFGFRF